VYARVVRRPLVARLSRRGLSTLGGPGRLVFDDLLLLKPALIAGKGGHLVHFGLAAPVLDAHLSLAFLVIVGVQGLY